METLIVTKIRNPKEARILLSINQRFGKSKILKGKYLEDFYFSKMLDEGMKSANIPLEQVHQELRK